MSISYHDSYRNRDNHRGYNWRHRPTDEDDDDYNHGHGYTYRKYESQEKDNDFCVPVDQIKENNVFKSDNKIPISICKQIQAELPGLEINEIKKPRINDRHENTSVSNSPRRWRHMITLNADQSTVSVLKTYL